MTVLYLGLGSLALLGILIWVARRWGRAEAHRDVAAIALTQASQSHEIDESVAGLNDRDLDQRLRDAGN